MNLFGVCQGRRQGPLGVRVSSWLNSCHRDGYPSGTEALDALRLRGVPGRAHAIIRPGRRTYGQPGVRQDFLTPQPAGGIDDAHF